jgi:small nuclear ribonucleoprotein (snRNP)-like protein
VRARVLGKVKSPSINHEEAIVKKLLLAITLVFSLPAWVPSHQAAVADEGTEISGVIKNVSVNVNLVVVDVSEQERKDESVKSQSSIKSVSVQPHTKITVDGKEATIQDLEAGQPVKVRLEAESSKAISIEAGTVMAENQ